MAMASSGSVVPSPSSGVLATAVYNFDETARRLGLSDFLVEKLRRPKERTEYNVHPVLHGGQSSHFQAYVVRHSDAIGPSKGGIRMTPTVTKEDITGLAMEMTWKTSLIGVPFGGGKSGICCETAGLSAQNKEIIIRAFARAVRLHIGPEIYIPAPDMGTNEVDMGHIRDCISYSAGTSITQGCFVTGKPVILGGIEGRREATGKGVVYSILVACEKLGLDMKGTKVVVQGFGNVGSAAAAEMARLEAKVIAVSDLSGGLVNPCGLDIPALVRHVHEAGCVKGFTGGQEVSGDQVLSTPCDILIPAASESQIHAANASKISARIVAEGANAPTTPEADEVLAERGVFVIPDILCNAGGVFVSYLEYTQETQREQMTAQEVERRLAERMRQRFNHVFDYARATGLRMRLAAMDVAVGRVVEAIEARGFLP